MKTPPDYTALGCDQQGSILKRTLDLLQADKRNLNRISMDTQVPLAWLSKLRNNEIADPSVNRIQYLYEKLSGKKL